MVDKSELEDICVKLTEAMGFSLVEMSIGRRRGEVRFSLVLYKTGGITLDDLTDAHRVLLPRLELEVPAKNLALEITSPGTSRRIKDPREYRIFIGRNIRLLIGEEWICGRLESYSGEQVSIAVGDETRSIDLHAVRKAKLD